MTAIDRLFKNKNMYDQTGTSPLFIEAMKEAVTLHSENNDFYRRLLLSKDFSPHQLTSEEALKTIPLTPAQLFKTHALKSVPDEAIVIHATSSGTEGQSSQIFIDEVTVKRATQMTICAMKTHGILSLKPCHYFILGYAPSPQNTMGNVKLTSAMMRFAPALTKTYVLKWVGNRYEIDYSGIISALKKYDRSPFPVRFMGFPAFLQEVFDLMDGLSIKCAKGSLVLTGGGWKRADDKRVEPETLRETIHQKLGIPPHRCRDFYSAVEHSVAYPECAYHHMHVPIWSRVLVRDVSTLAPLPFDTPGFLNFISPLMNAMPLNSVLMGDIGVLRDGSACKCGAATPYFEVLGRMNAIAMKGCALSASEKLGGFAHDNTL